MYCWERDRTVFSAVRGERGQGQRGGSSSVGGSAGLEPRVQEGGWPDGRLESVAGEPV